jgi:hypothetical protein
MSVRTVSGWAMDVAVFVAERDDCNGMRLAP